MGILLNVLLTYSAKEKKPIEIIYMSKEGSITQRFITVYSFNDNRVLAYCHYRRALRTFKRDHILSAASSKKVV